MSKNTNKRNKSVRENYKPDPFYFTEYLKDYDKFRYTAWSYNLDQTRDLFYKLLDYFPKEVEVLLKIRKEGDDWDWYFTEIKLVDLMDALISYDEYFFNDGGHQFCIKNLETDEYIVNDEHGIIFIYSFNHEFADELERNGYLKRDEELIYEKDHWHIHIKDYEIVMKEIIDKLNLVND